MCECAYTEMCVRTAEVMADARTSGKEKIIELVVKTEATHIGISLCGLCYRGCRPGRRHRSTSLAFLSL